MARYQIKEVAQRQGISLRQIALKGRLSETRIRDLANNRLDNVTVRTLEVIAATLNVPLREIFKRATLDEVPMLSENEPSQGETIRPSA